MNSSLAGAALMLGITPAIMERLYPVIRLADEYDKAPDKIKRDELILRLEIYCLTLKVDQIEAHKRKPKKKE